MIQAEIGEGRDATRPSLGKAQRQRLTGELERCVATTAIQAALQGLQEAGVVRGHLLSLFVEKSAHRGDPRDGPREFSQERRGHRGRRGFTVGARNAYTEQGAGPRWSTSRRTTLGQRLVQCRHY